jgi:integrase
MRRVTCALGKRGYTVRAYIALSTKRGTWQLRYYENGVRKQKQLGTIRDWPNRAEAERANAHLLNLYNKPKQSVPTIADLIAKYRASDMPERASTRRGYESYFENHIIPKWGAVSIAEFKPDPLEQWLRSLDLSIKTKRNIRWLMSVLWNFANKKEHVPQESRNPVDHVQLRKRPGEKRRLPVRSLTAEQFQSLLGSMDFMLRVLFTVQFSLGLRISEVLGLKWKDVDWLGKEISIERGMVKQIEDLVKTKESEISLPVSDGLLEMLKQWKPASQFAGVEDWIFASPWKLGKQPIGYTHIWESLDAASRKAGIGHVSSHAMRNAFRSWLDSLGLPVGLQQRMMRHSSVTTTMNDYGTALKSDMRAAHEKVFSQVSAGFRVS